MRISVASHEIEAMIVASGERRLQSVVSRSIKIREVVDESQVWGLGGKGQRARYRIGLIEINDAGKLHSMVANVGHVETKLSGESMLDAQRPVHHVRSAEIAIHSEGVARTWIASDSVSALNKSSDVGRINWGGLILPGKAAWARSWDGDSRRENVSDGWFSGRRDGAVPTHWSRWTSYDRGPSGNGAEAKKSWAILEVLLRHVSAHGQQIVNDAAASANDRRSLASHVPSNPQARGEILVVALVDGTDVFAHLFKADRRLPIPEQVFGLGRNSLEFVAEPQVEGHSLGDAPVILHVARIKPLRDVPGRISRQEAGAQWIAREKRFQISKFDAASPAPVSGLMDQVPSELSAKFEGMLAAQIGDLIDEVIDLIGPDNFRKVVEGTQLREGAVGEPDVRNTAQQRIGNTGVDLVGESEIVRQNLENIVRETCAELVGPRGTRGPGPVASDGLCAGMNFGAELREDLEEVHAHDGVIAKEIRAA